MSEQHEDLSKHTSRGNPATTIHRTMVKKASLLWTYFFHSCVCSITGGNNYALHKTDTVTSLLFQAEFDASSEFSSDKTMLCSAAAFFHRITSCRGKKYPNNQSEPFINCLEVPQKLVLRSVFQFR